MFLDEISDEQVEENFRPIITFAGKESLCELSKDNILFFYNLKMQAVDQIAEREELKVACDP